MAGFAIMTYLSMPAAAQLVVKSEDVTLKLGLQGQLWGDWNQDSTGKQGYQQNYFLRRARIIVGADSGQRHQSLLRDR